MRIAHMILSRGFAGTERSTAEMCNAHCEAHQVLLILRHDHTRAGKSIREFLDPRVAVVEVNGWLPSARVERALRRFRPQVIHAHLRRSVRVLARLRPPAATVATLHMGWNGSHFHAMDGVICIADWQKRVVPPHYAGRVFRINESHVPHRRLAENERQELRRELGAGPQDYLVGGVGRLSFGKGFDVLLAAFRRANLPDARLAIIGDGRQLPLLRLSCSATAHLFPFRANVKDYYQAFDLFVSPARREPLGRVVLEALDAGVPVIATRTLGPTELLTHFGGELVPIAKVPALADAIRRHYTDRVRRSPADLSEYHFARVAAQTERAYRELIARRERRPAAEAAPTRAEQSVAAGG